MVDPFAFIIQYLLSAVSVLFLVRFILQATHADFFNPISQGIIRYTDPVLGPLRKVIPTYKNLDLSAFFATWVTCAATIGIVAAMTGRYDNMVVVELLQSLGITVGAVVAGVYRTFDLFLFFYWIAIFAMIIISLLAPTTYNPVTSLLRDICEPVLSPARRLLHRLLPVMGGLDLSPIIVFLVILLLQNFLLPGLFRALFGGGP